MKYVVFKEINDSESYWRGKFTESGQPMASRSADKAVRFETPRSAYEEAAKYRMFQWKGGARK